MINIEVRRAPQILDKEGGAMKLTAEAKKTIAKLRLIENLPEKWIADKYGVHRCQIIYIVKLAMTYGYDYFDTTPKRRKYSIEFKEEIVKKLLNKEDSVINLALKNKISDPSLIYQWLHNYKKNCGKIVDMKQGPKKKTTIVDNQDVSSLLERIKYLEAECDYLKKLNALTEQKEKLLTEKKR